jgi:thiamine biosynthesis lipoprotein
MTLPLGDPQFWIVTAAVAAALGWALYRVLRQVRRPEGGCASCPQAGGPRRVEHRSERREGAKPSALLLLGLIAGAQVAAAGEPLVRVVAAMGTTLTVEVEGLERAAALALSERLIEAVEATEARLSTWRGDSELARFNRAPAGAPFALSPETARALAVALDCARESGGRFDPTVAPLVEAWGLRAAGRRPDAAELARALAQVGAASQLRLGADGRALTKLAPLRLEEGGFGKGAALAEALRLARAAGARVRLDLGGQRAWSAGAAPSPLLLADPRERSRPVAALALGPGEGSLATSGNSERAVQGPEAPIGHLLDPTTGRPAPDFGSVASLDGDPAYADCRSTALFVAGPERGLDWLAAGGRGEAVFLEVRGARLVARASAGLAGRLEPLVPDLTIEVSKEPKESS